MDESRADQRLTVGEALASLRRYVVQPEPIPARVAAAVVGESAPPDGPMARLVAGWDVAPATGAAPAALARVVRAAHRGRADPADLMGVDQRYGAAGLVAVLSVAAVLRIEDPAVPPVEAGPFYTVRAGPPPPELSDTLLMIRRSFGRIPPLWATLALDPAGMRRWWQLHESVLVPGALTGQEKWLSMVAVSSAAGDQRLGSPYEELLVGAGWGEAPLSSAVVGEGGLLSRHFATALRGARQLAAGLIDEPRARLAAAGLHADQERELLDLVAFVRGLVCFRPVVPDTLPDW